MLDIPYVQQDKNACALACYTMTAKYFFPEVTYKQVGEISNWKKGYVVWPFRFWLWMAEKGIKIRDYDLIDYEAWSEKGAQGLKESVSQKEYQWLKKNSTDLDEIGNNIANLFKQKNFTYKRKKPQFSHLENGFNKHSVCEVVLDSRTLNNQKGFSLHRVVVTDIGKDYVKFHDPKPEAGPHRKETKDLFKKSWLDAVDDSELCIYSK